MGGIMKLLTEIPYVALMLRTSAKTYREILHGILRFTKQTNVWSLQISQGREADQNRLQLGKVRYSGVIIDETDELFGDLGRFRGIPVCTVENARPKRPLGRHRICLYCDNDAIGREGARHLLSRGYENFAYVNDTLAHRWSRERGAAFAAELKRNGRSCRTYLPPSAHGESVITRDIKSLSAWLTALPKPVAIFVSNDLRARDVLSICDATHIGVPQDALVLGCDDEELVCETSTPTLSSIRFSTEQAGMQAARALSKLIAGETELPESDRLIPYGPSCVVTRHSTERQRMDDKLVESALHLIRLNAFNGLCIPDLAKRLGAQRRTLELRFKRATGHSPYQEILNTKLRRAQEFLRDNTMSLDQIAEACGFPDASHLGVMFKRKFGMTPSAYRKGR